MIEFVCGRAGSGKSEYICSRLKERLSGASPEKKLYLIVPEQQTVVWESRAARTLPPSAPLSLEIVNFTRLANLVARTFGGLAENRITRGGKAALMWSVLTSLSPSLAVYGGGRRADRAVPALLSAVSEMKRCGVTPAALTEAAQHLSGEAGCERLAARAGDLALVYAAYSQLLSARYDDDEDELAHLAVRLRTEDFFAGADVFVDSFFSLTPVENEILYHILRQADNVTVTFSCPADGAAETHFSSARKFLSTMRRAADRAGKEYRILSLAENRRARSAPLAYLEANLWRFDAPPYAGEDADGSVCVLRARDRYAEADAAACRIAQLIQGGARYGEIALIARDAGALRGILDTALAKRNIPYFFSENTDVPSRPAAQLLFCALSVCSGGWRREDVIRCAKTGLCGLTDDECDALEAYTETWHIRGARAFGSPWNMNPDGYVPTMSARARATLLAANAARDKLAAPLERFAGVFCRGAAPVREICRACYELLCEFGVWDALAASSASLAEACRAREASEEAQLWDILMDALDTLADALPDAEADAAAFSALLRQALGAVRIGAIPGGADEIVIGSADQVRLGEVAHVILLGAAEGEFPGTPADDGFFSDTDKVRLEGEGVVLSEKTEDRMKDELFWFYRAASLACCTLTVLIPDSDGGTPLSPSLGAERILALFGTLRVENSAAWGARERVWHPTDACADAFLLRGTPEGEALSRLGVIPPVRLSPLPLSAGEERIRPETASLLFGRDISLTQSRLDAFVLCRFGCYCRYEAKLREEKEASLTAVNVGTFVHRVLELFFSRTEGRQMPLPEEELSHLTDGIVEDTVGEICPGGASGGRARYLFTRLKRCVLPMLRSLGEEFARSEFRPAFFELPVGTGGAGAVPPYRIPAGEGRFVCLRGTIDRLDVWRDGEETYVRVVDYKTGAKKFSPEDISVGVNAQLLIYLFSVLHCPPGEFRRALTGSENGTIRAAGALYFSARPGETSSDVLLSREEAERLAADNVARSGFLCANERVLRAMEPELAGRFLPVRMKKDKLSGGTVLDGDGMEALEQTMRETIARIGGELCEGGAQAVPRMLHGQNPCEWCAMKRVCRAARGKEEL